MAQPKVSLLMPVYNSFSYERSDGKNLLPAALNALLGQSFTDFELIILDNQSTDDTPRICKEYASRDARIRYVADTQKRFAEEAIGHLASLARAPYCLIVNDDDLWEKQYIEKAVCYLDKHPEVDLVYGRVIFIDPQNAITGLYAAPASERYIPALSTLEGFGRYLQFRNVLPINFGLFRTEAFKAILPYEDFDTLKSNVDNLLMAKFFLLGLKAQYVEDLTFFYRRKSRRLNPAVFAKDMPSLSEPIGIWLFYVRHQLLFQKKIAALLERTQPEVNTTAIRALLAVNSLYYCFDLLRWLRGEMESQQLSAEALKISTLLKEGVRLREDLSTYPLLEDMMGKNFLEGVTFSSHIASEARATLGVFRALLEKGRSLEATEDNRKLLDKIDGLLTKEFFDYLPTSSTPDPLMSVRIRSIRREPTTYSLREFFKDHPRVKRAAFFLRTLWLQVRFYRYVPYIRSLQGES